MSLFFLDLQFLYALLKIFLELWPKIRRWLVTLNIIFVSFASLDISAIF